MSELLSTELGEVDAKRVSVMRGGTKGAMKLAKGGIKGGKVI